MTLEDQKSCEDSVSTTRLVAGVVQMSSSSDKPANLDRAESMIRDLVASTGAELICIPEVFAWRGPSSGEAEIAETIPGPTTRRFTGLSQELGIHLILGSLLERSPDSVLPYNSSVMLAPDGSITATYRKIHLFDVDIEGHGAVRESATRARGSEAVIARMAVGDSVEPIEVGLSICYDLRFPELYRQLCFRGARILTIPASFTTRTGRAHWIELVRARAIENLAFVIAPNQYGMGREGIDTFGHSVIVDPWGTILAQCGDGEGWASAALDLQRQTHLRKSFPVLDHVRLIESP